MRKIYLLLGFSLTFGTLFGQNSLQSINNGQPQSQKKNVSAKPIKTNTHATFSNNVNVERNKGIGHNNCKSHELTKKYYESIGKWDDFNATYLNTAGKVNPPATAKTPGVNTIAIIFHVVHNPNNPNENVSNALIMQVYNDITQDFQLLNADASNARSSFGFTPADANINFCLATKTPTGTPLTEVGVVRVSTTEDWYNSDNGEENKMKSATTGGSTIWDRNKYLNVWICDISNGANSGTAGYAYRPTTTYLPSSSIDGIVLDYNLGMNNDNVLTHEIGHYLGLDHTWGGSGSCSMDDGFTDTPNTAGPSFNYSGSCSGNQTTCSSTQTQYENYMDYSNCTVMYTQLQANYMLSILTGIRASLLSSTGCDPVNAPPVANFNADISSPIIIPVGGSVNFFDLSTNVPTSWLWNFGGGAANSTQQNPSITFNTIGTYTVTLTATNAYGNDSEIKTGYIQVVAAATGTACDTLRNYNRVTETSATYSWIAPSTGYFPGTGRISGGTVPITQYAERYTVSASTKVRRLRFPIARAVNQTGTGLMKIRVHQDNGGGNPGTIMVTDTFLIADMSPGYYNEFDFTFPQTVTGNFWVSFEVIYTSPLDSIALYCVNVTNRATVGVNTLRSYYSGAWHPTSDFMSAPNNKTSLWLDVLTSNGPAPVADFTYSDVEICAGGQVVVNGSSSTNTTNYYWYVTNNASPPTIFYAESFVAANAFTFNTAGTRRIYLFADGSCMTDGLYLPITINAIPSATVTAANTTCGINNGTITVTNPTGGDTPNYTYSIDGVNFQTSGSFTGLAPGTYIVHIKTPGDNCDRTYSRTITASTELNASVSSSTTICTGGSATLTASGGSQYTWYDGATSIGSTASITVTPTATNQYTCLVSDGNCQATVYTYVNVDNCNLGIAEYIKEVKIYPNPTKEMFFIELPGEFNYSIYDSRGRIIAHGSALDKESINTASYQGGVYILKLTNETFEHSFRIIKQ